MPKTATAVLCPLPVTRAFECQLLYQTISGTGLCIFPTAIEYSSKWKTLFNTALQAHYFFGIGI